MHRTHVGGGLAVLVPPVLWMHVALAIPVAIALGATRSLAAWLGALAGLCIVWPWMLGPSLALAVLGVWTRHRFPPGAIVDTARARLLSWIYLAQHLSWRGYGAGSARLACEAAHIRSGGLAMDGGPARNEMLQVAFEYGVAGVGVMALIGWRLSRVVQLGDVLSGALVAGLVLACGTSFLRTPASVPWWLCLGWMLV